jgi:excisionase family DNA binding protein
MVSVPALLNGRDIGRLLQVSPATAYRLMQQGEIAVVQLGKSRRVTIEALEEFIQRKTVPAGTGGGSE